MDWITQEAPKKTGTYLISLIFNEVVYNYIAIFNFEQGRWFKFDPYLEPIKGEEIPSGTICAWKEKEGVFIGRPIW